MKKLGWLIAGLCTLALTGFAQDAEETEAPPDRFERLRQQASRMISGLRQFGDWEPHYDLAIDAVDRVYERNGWDSEPDLFSLELARRVGQIPPWQFRERFDLAFRLLGDRYLLDEEQSQLLQQVVMRENIRLFTKHSDRIMEYAMDAISTRAAGEPFTAEQVARWTELAAPVMLDSRNSINRAAGQFKQHLDPEQRELLDADLAAANHRLAAVEQMAEGWIRGEWDPSDWGLEDDPIQNEQWAGAGPQADEPRADLRTNELRASDGQSVPNADNPRRNAAAEKARRIAERERKQDSESGAASGAVPPPPPPPEQTSQKREPGSKKTVEDEWSKHVRAFIAKYQLNDEQQQRAWLFHKDALSRRTAMEKRIKRQVSEISGTQDERIAAKVREVTERHQSDVKRIFERLKDRLEQLPTRAQRRKAATAAGDGEQKP